MGAQRWCSSRAAARLGSGSWGRVEKECDGKQIPTYFKCDLKYVESTEQGIDLGLMIPAGVLPEGEGKHKAECEEGLGLVCSPCSSGDFVVHLKTGWASDVLGTAS